MKMKTATLATTYKFNFGVTRDAVRNAFDNAGLVFALREAMGVIKTLSGELRQTQHEYQDQIARTENILSGIQEYQKQGKSERNKIAKDVVDYWLQFPFWWAILKIVRTHFVPTAVADENLVKNSACPSEALRRREPKS